MGKISIKLAALPVILLKPKQGFESVKESASLESGLVMALILAILYALVSTLELTLIESAGSIANLALAALITIILPMVGLLVFGWLSAKLAREVYKGTGDIGKTTCFLGYGAIVPLTLAIIRLAVIALTGVIPADVSGAVEYEVLSATVGKTAIMAGIAFFFLELIWKLYVNSHAVAAANKIPLYKGAVITILVGAISIMVVALIVGALFFFLNLAAPLNGISGYFAAI
ncbi:MAG: YIP1 family protein [Candidatus Diapherotrites archaeon]|uniref:YIP1 family protein n=1 Tax=Candidatus Iainarchaeum sp. TaxID=3101447 RepID=A0A939CA50_9ARCH|nr:YIP1 family protein [Candidatus Diapherotrites archaeon]